MFSGRPREINAGELLESIEVEAMLITFELCKERVPRVVLAHQLSLRRLGIPRWLDRPTAGYQLLDLPARALLGQLVPRRAG